MTGIDEIDDLLFLFENPGSPSGTPNEPPLPSEFELEQSFPNPFIKSTFSSSPQISIPFKLNQATEVKLEVFNLKGQQVATLIHAHLAPGRYQGKLSAENLSPGMYFYRLSSIRSARSGRAILLH
jgi:hypothetical protein